MENLLVPNHKIFERNKFKLLINAISQTFLMFLEKYFKIFHNIFFNFFSIIYIFYLFHFPGVE